MRKQHTCFGNFKRSTTWIILLIATTYSSLASLVICVFNDNRLFLGSDSLMYFPADTNKNETRNKIFKLSAKCYVSTTGDYGKEFTVNQAGREPSQFRILLPRELEVICTNETLSAEPLQRRIGSVVTHFGQKYASYAKLSMQAHVQSNAFEGTRLFFVGYDDERHAFFGSSCSFQGTNESTMERVFERSPTNKLGGNFSIQGEMYFLSALVGSPDPKFAALGSQGLRDGLRDIALDNPMSEKRVVESILEMFRLHKQHAAKLTSDKGWIGEPFVIYMISKEAAWQVH